MITVISLIVCISCLFISFFGDIAQFVYYGFGIDSSGTVYLGFSEKIVKYKDGERIGSIPVLYRGYVFELLKDDTILCADGSNSHILDLNGKELQVIKNTGSQEYNRIFWGKRTFTASDGQEYVMRTPFGRRTIKTKEGEIVWRMPFRDYLVFLLLFVSFCVVMGCNLIIIYHYRIAKDWSL